MRRGVRGSDGRSRRWSVTHARRQQLAHCDGCTRRGMRRILGGGGCVLHRLDAALRCMCVVMPLVTVPVLTAQTLLRGLFPAYLGDP